MLKIDQYTYANALRSIHPVEKMVFALLTMVICLVASSMLTSLLIIFIMTAGVIWGARIPILYYFKLLLIPVSFIIIGALWDQVS